MRPGNNNNNRRGRNRGPRKPHGGMPNKNQNFDGGGSDTRVRGNVYQVLEKYLQLARDAGVAGDRVAAENFLQHADHYYRVITTMNDGQRPRVGGREISVADVNVQNVSQGLSAALYSGGPSQPSMSDTGSPTPSQQQGNGNPRGNDGFNANQNNGHGGNNQGNAHGGDNQTRDGQSRDNIGRDNQGRDGNVRVSHGGDSHGGDSGGGGEYVQQGHHRGNRGRGNNAGGRNAGSYGNASGSHQQSNANLAPDDIDRAPVANVQSAPAPTSDEQPDYPEHLLPAPAPEAAVEGARAPRDGARAPRGRLRVRRPRLADGDGESAPDVTSPATEGSE